MNTEEVWKQIDKNAIYLVSNLGAIKTKNSLFGRPKLIDYKPLKISIDSTGYYVFNLYRKPTRVHRVMAEAFIPNPGNKRCINHKNGIKTDNSLENLEWCTHSENTIHAFTAGLVVSKKRGQNHNAVKVDQLDLNGNYIKTFECMTDAAISLGTSIISGIYAVCMGGKRKTALGYKWKRTNHVNKIKK